MINPISSIYLSKKRRLQIGRLCAYFSLPFALLACVEAPPLPTWVEAYELGYLADPEYTQGRDEQNDHWLRQSHDMMEASHGATIDRKHY
ncbi:MAG: hypothetical protein JKY01_07785 [Pseudomonadales bacterium]|nr:hypothetical protein [Pseudomonadales bacterium]